MPHFTAPLVTANPENQHFRPFLCVHKDQVLTDGDWLVLQ